MSSAHAGVYVRDDYSAPMSAQHNFANQFDLDNPSQSMSIYARYVVTLLPSRHCLQSLIQHSIMHEHTKHQLESATSSARRRSQGSSTSESSRMSVSSASS